MTTLPQKLQLTLDSKNAIKKALQDKGVDITDDTPFEDYANVLDGLSNNWDFIDSFTIASGSTVRIPRESISNEAYRYDYTLGTKGQYMEITVDAARCGYTDFGTIGKVHPTISIWNSTVGTTTTEMTANWTYDSATSTFTSEPYTYSTKTDGEFYVTVDGNSKLDNQFAKITVKIKKTS